MWGGGFHKSGGEISPVVWASAWLSDCCVLASAAQIQSPWKRIWQGSLPWLHPSKHASVGGVKPPSFNFHRGGMMCESRTVTTALAGQAEGASGRERQRGRDAQRWWWRRRPCAVRERKREECERMLCGGKDRGNHEWRSAAWLPRIPQRRASSILCGVACIHLRRRWRRRNRLDERGIEGWGDARAWWDGSVRRAAGETGGGGGGPNVSPPQLRSLPHSCTLGCPPLYPAFVLTFQNSSAAKIL